jgi:hypothetical protein
MREFSDIFLDKYLAAEGTAILDSVGGYRLEGRGVQLVQPASRRQVQITPHPSPEMPVLPGAALAAADQKFG